METAACKKIASDLKAGKREYFIVDVGDSLPPTLTNKPCIVIDVARKGALEQYIAEFWTGMIFLNETYPEPSKKVIKDLERIGIPSYHVSGVKAEAFPRFPKPYSGGVPCCALINDENLQAIIRKLSA